MSFTPNGKICLCKVDFDSTYQHQVYFNSKQQQQEYFSQKVVKTFNDYTTVRTTRADGSLKSSVKVECNIDVLRTKACNYMYYQNLHHGNRIFYAFIKQLIYINEDVTEIVFETDVYQTWLFDVEVLQSYVVREHHATDNIGANVVPEKFNFQDYTYEEKSNIGLTGVNKIGYLVGSAEPYDDTNSRGAEYTGVYQGLFYFYYEDTTKLNDLLTALEKKGGDCIVFVCAVPRVVMENVGKTPIFDSDKAESELLPAKEGCVHTSDFAINMYHDFNLNRSDITFEGYKPKNNKLFTYPFTCLEVTNHAGSQVEYHIEDFVFNKEDSGLKDIAFHLYADISGSPSICLIPVNYKNCAENYDFGIDIGGFPQCGINTDTYKLWLAKNQYSNAMDIAGGIGSILGGIGMLVATPISGGTSTVAGVGMIAGGVTGILQSANNNYQASKEPNKAQTGTGKNNLLTAMGYNDFVFYIRTIKKNYAQTVDTFFTMYGYQVNRVKQPNLDSRPCFNYIQTIDVNLVGGIPNDDLEVLKSIYNKGVTLWKPTTTIGDYSQDNSPVEE